MRKRKPKPKPARQQPPAGKRTPARRVDFMGEESDFLCLWYAELGFTTDCIAKQTGLTKSQVQYRIGAGGQTGTRADYRSGKSNLAAKMLERAPTRQERHEIRDKIPTDYA